MGSIKEHEGIEVYLSRDIIQGEEIPFYILMHRNDIERITIKLKRFEKVTEYHNLVDNFPIEKRVIRINDLKSPDYLGGILKTDETEDPYLKATLKLIFTLSNGNNIEIIEERTLFTTHVEIISPDLIKVPMNKPPINILLKGSTTIFINIESTKDSEIEITLPDEIKYAFEKIYESFLEGMETLKKEYPNYVNEIDLITNFIFDKESYTLSKQEYQYKFNELSKILKSKMDLLEGFMIVYFNSILSHSSIRDLFFGPLLEYFKSSIAQKVFLESPLLFLKVPKGGGYLKAILYYEDLLERIKIIREITDESISIVDLLTKFDANPEKNKRYFEIFIKSKDEIQIPLKNFLDIRRCFDEGYK